MNRLILGISLLLWAYGCKATGERAPPAVRRNAVEGAVRAPEPSKVTLDVKNEDLAVVLQDVTRIAFGRPSANPPVPLGPEHDARDATSSPGGGSRSE